MSLEVVERPADVAPLAEDDGSVPASGVASRPRAVAASSWLLERGRPAELVAIGVALALATGGMGALKAKMAFALVGAVAVVLAICLRPVIGGYLLVAVVPAISGLAPGLPVQHVRLSELFIGLVSLTLFVTTRRKDRLRFDALDWLLLVYGLCWTAFAIYDASALHEPMSLSLWGTSIGQLQFFLMYRAIRMSVRTLAERKRAVVAAFGGAVAVSLIALAQAARLPGIEHFIVKMTAGVPEFSAGLLRATGPFDNWAALAGYLFPLVLLMVAFGLGKVKLWKGRRAVVVTAIITLGLLTTVELSAILSLLASIIWLGVRYGRTSRVLKWLGTGLLLAAVTAGPLVSSRIQSELTKTAGIARGSVVPQTISYRMHIWTGQYFPAIAERPFEGYGVVLPPTIAWPYPESQYVGLLIEGGIPTLVSFVVLAGAMIDRCRKGGRSRDPFEAALCRSLAMVGVALFAMDSIWPYFSNGGLPQILWALLAVAAPAWADTGLAKRELVGPPEQWRMALPSVSSGPLSMEEV